MGYRLTAASVYVQLLNAGMRFSLKQAGYSYLTLENGGKVLLCPWTIPVVLALMASTTKFTGFTWVRVRYKQKIFMTKKSDAATANSRNSFLLMPEKTSGD